MTETAAQPVAAEVDAWLSRFESALTEGDTAAAAELFTEDSFWRDLVSFTWNLKTVEGRAGVKDMLDHTLAAHEAARLAHDRAADRGRRHLRRVDRVRDRGRPRPRPPAPARRPGVDAADDALRAQGPRGAARRRAPARGRARRRPRPRDVARGPRARGARARPHDPARRRHRRRRPGRDRARRPPAAARRPDDHRRAQRAPRRLLAQALQVALPPRPGLVRPPAVHQVPRELAGLLAEGQDRRLAGDVHAGHGAQLLDLHDRQERALRRGRPASGWSSSSATARRSRCGPSSS